MTGFWAKDLKGIITALHGVVGCKIITAMLSNSDSTFTNLKIQQVDIKRDTALLYSPEMAYKTLPEGFSSLSTKLSYDNVYVIGYPLGITESIISRDLRIRDKAYRQLESLLPPDSKKVLAERQSPSLDVDVISIEGHLLHGHSGAPVLNSKDQIIGIANGGLNDGSAEIVWAIPWQDIEWQDANKKT
ncbi:MAG: trypsin-like peptidase domain-containing protein, partial [bacterium]|nr:trypsin-like peptidase domain-containing protein [bacterium]